RFPAAAKTFCATFGAALSLAPGSPPSVFGGAPARTRLAALCFRRRSRLRSARRPLFRCGGFRRRQRLFVRPSAAALPLTLGSPPSVSAALSLRSVRRSLLAAALSLTPGSPLRWGGALARARFALVLKAVLKKTPALFFEHGRLLPHNFARFR
ncbi:MAG: hypothetical protein MR987_00385, partial [Oscillospiraceae bacterium]|nr:hypothetical protein [Oscillospiraceae bacterium]